MNADTKLFRELIAEGMSAHDAARQVDWGIARRCAAKRLAAKGSRRNPTEAEVEAVYRSM